MRRRRCSRCGELHNPAELSEVGHDRLCPGCLEREADTVPAEDHPELADPALADAIDAPVGRRVDTPAQAREVIGTMLREPDSFDVEVPLVITAEEWDEADQDAMVLPAPTLQVDVPMPDLRDEDEKEAAPEPRWNLPSWDVPGWPLRYGRISASALGTFARCPEQFRRRYVLGERDRSSGSGITGTAIHKALERAYSYLMAQGEPPPVELAVEALDESISVSAQKQEERFGAVEWGHDGSRKKEPMTEAGWRTRGRVVLDSYLEHVLPSVAEPVAVEQVFTAAVPGVDVPIVGFLDLITTRALVDFKFGSKRAFQVSPEWRIAGLVYLLARDLPMTWHSMNWSGEYATPLAEPGLVLPNSYANFAIATDLTASLTRAILSYAQAFGRDQPWPGNVAHTWACSTCFFRDEAPDRCVWWHRDLAADVL